MTDIVGSKEPPFKVASDFAAPGPGDNTRNGYGQNGYSGPSSDTDLSNPTRSALSVALFGPHPQVKIVDQTRDVGKSNVPNAYGMKGPKPSAKI